MFKKILLGFDGSAGSHRALTEALSLAKGSGCELWCVAVIESLPAYAGTIGEVEEEKERASQYFLNLLKDASDRAKKMNVEMPTKRLVGHPSQTLVDFAEQGSFDLIVVGHSGSSGVWGRFLGTTADKITRHAHCSVLVVR